MADVEDVKPVIDLTLTLDPAEFYGADLAGCPAWPVIHPMNPDPLMIRAGDAEKRIEQIREQLHPGDGPLREPSDAERQSLRERLFTEERPVGFEHPDEASWRARHGIGGLIPRDQSQVRRLNLIVEACHVWGFIEKTRLQAERGASAKVTADRARSEQELQRCISSHADYVAEYETIKEAAERHRQRCEDERAFHRSREILRNVLPGLAKGARDAANDLGVEPPSLSEVA